MDMMDMTPTPVTIAVLRETRDLVDAAIREHKRRQADTAAAFRCRHDFAKLRRAEQAEIRASILAAARRRRAQGVLLDTRDALVTEAVRRELDARGIDPAAPPAVRAGAGVSGRWIGSRPNAAAAEELGPPAARLPAYDHRVCAMIPAAYAAAVTAAAYDASAPYIEALRAWDQAHPQWNGFRRTITHAAAAERDQLSAHMTTPGDVYRAALHRVTTP